MRKSFLNALKSLLVTSLAFVSVFVLVFLYKFYEVYEVVVVHPPCTDITLRQVNGLELIDGGPTDITPQFFQDHHQYEIWIKSSNPNPITSTVNVLIQFPYWVEEPFKIESRGAEGISFVPAASLPMIVGANTRVLGKTLHKSYWLSISDMKSNGEIRLVVLLDSNPPQSSIVIGNTGSLFRVMPPQPLPPALGPKYEYIHVYTGFSYGGQLGHTEGYAPFQVNGTDRTISLGALGPVPKGLQVCAGMICGAAQ